MFISFVSMFISFVTSATLCCVLRIEGGFLNPRKPPSLCPWVHTKFKFIFLVQLIAILNSYPHTYYVSCGQTQVVCFLRGGFTSHTLLTRQSASVLNSGHAVCIVKLIETELFVMLQ